MPTLRRPSRRVPRIRTEAGRLWRVLNVRQRLAEPRPEHDGRSTPGAWSLNQLGERVGRLRQQVRSGSSAKGYDYNGFHAVRDGANFILQPGLSRLA